MRHFQRFICLILFFLLYPSLVNAQDDTDFTTTGKLRILTFNIFHGEIHSPEKGESAANNLGIVSEIINAIKPDLVALQEVDCKTNRSSGIDLLTELALSTKMYSSYGRAMKFDGGEYGLGILSKYSFSSTKVRPLFSPPGSEPRIALESLIVLETGDTIRFVCTHLDHRDPEIRINQAKDLIKYFGNGDYPCILAGDLNARPESKTMALINTIFKDSWKEGNSDSPATHTERRIDYVLYTPDPIWKSTECRVIDGRNASDHNPVLSVFNINQKTP